MVIEKHSVPTDVAWMIVVALLWAICFPFIVIGLPDAPPLLFAALRALLAGVLLLLVGMVQQYRGSYLPDLRNVVHLGLIGLSYTAMGFGGMFLGAGHLSPGLATVLSGTQPLIAAAIAGSWLGETLKARGIAGLSIGFMGVAILSWPGFGGSNESYLWGIAWILMAAIGTAIGNILLKKEAGGPIALPMAIQLLIGGGTLLLASAMAGEHWEVGWTIQFTGSLLILSVLATAAMIFIWFGLLARAPLNRLNVFSFLTPVFGLMIGFLFYAERLQLGQVLGIVLILGGVVLLHGRNAVLEPAKEITPF